VPLWYQKLFWCATYLLVITNYVCSTSVPGISMWCATFSVYTHLVRTILVADILWGTHIVVHLMYTFWATELMHHSVPGIFCCTQIWCALMSCLPLWCQMSFGVCHFGVCHFSVHQISARNFLGCATFFARNL